jgi:hypothetical protein
MIEILTHIMIVSIGLIVATKILHYMILFYCGIRACREKSALYHSVVIDLGLIIFTFEAKSDMSWWEMDELMDNGEYDFDNPVTYHTTITLIEFW